MGTKSGHLAAKDIPLREGLVLRLGDGRWWKIVTVTDKEVRYTVPYNGGWSTRPSLVSRADFNEAVDKDAEGAKALPDDSLPTWSTWERKHADLQEHEHPDAAGPTAESPDRGESGGELGGSLDER